MNKVSKLLCTLFLLKSLVGVNIAEASADIDNAFDETYKCIFRFMPRIDDGSISPHNATQLILKKCDSALLYTTNILTQPYGKRIDKSAIFESVFNKAYDETYLFIQNKRN